MLSHFFLLPITTYNLTSPGFVENTDEIVRYREHLRAEKQERSVKGFPSSVTDHVKSTLGSSSIFRILFKANNSFDVLTHGAL